MWKCGSFDRTGEKGKIRNKFSGQAGFAERVDIENDAEKERELQSFTSRKKTPEK